MLSNIGAQNLMSLSSFDQVYRVRHIKHSMVRSRKWHLRKEVFDFTLLVKAVLCQTWAKRCVTKMKSCQCRQGQQILCTRTFCLQAACHGARSKTHKSLKECLLIGRNRTKRANFRRSPLFQARYSRKKNQFNLSCVS